MIYYYISDNKLLSKKIPHISQKKKNGKTTCIDLHSRLIYLLYILDSF